MTLSARISGLRFLRRLMMFAAAGSVLICAGNAPSGLRSVETRMPQVKAIEDEIARRIEPAQTALKAAMTREDELKDFAAWKHVTGLDARLHEIQALQEAGELTKAYDKAFSMTTKWKTDRVTAMAGAMPFLVLGPINGDRFTDRKQARPLPLAGALDEAFLGELDTAEPPTGIHYEHPEHGRTRHRLPRAPDPWEAADELAALDPAPVLRQAWLIDGEWDFGDDKSAPGDAWGLYYAWTEIHSPELRGMGFDLNATVPCMYIWLEDLLQLVQRCQDRHEPRSAWSQRFGGRRFNEGWNRMFIKMLMRPGEKTYLRFIHHPRRRGDEMFIDDLSYRLPPRE